MKLSVGVPKTLRNITIVLYECNSSVKCILGYGNCAIVTMKHEHNKRKVKVGLCGYKKMGGDFYQWYDCY